MGLHHDQLTFTHLGRDERLTGTAGNPIKQPLEHHTQKNVDQYQTSGGERRDLQRGACDEPEIRDHRHMHAPLRQKHRTRIEQAGQSRTTQALRGHMLSVWSRLLGWQKRRTTRLILAALDDRTLADIGVPRGEIDKLSREMERRIIRWHR